MPISCGLLNGVVGAGADVAGGGVELAKLGERIDDDREGGEEWRL